MLNLWSPDVNSQLTGKDPGVGKDGGEEEKGTTEHEMVGWHHRLNGHEFEAGDGQGSLACCSPWGHKESDTTEPLNHNRKDPLGCVSCLSCLGTSALPSSLPLSLVPSLPSLPLTHLH